MEEWTVKGIEIDPQQGKPYFLATFFGSGVPDLIVELLVYGMPEQELKIISTSVKLADTNDESTGIPASRLREIPFGHLSLKALFSLRHPANTHLVIADMVRAPLGEPTDVASRYDFDALRKEWPKGDLKKVSEAVADVYISSLTSAKPPKPTVAELFSVSTATASRMIAKARELGILAAQSAGGRPKAKGTDNGEEEATDR